MSFRDLRYPENCPCGDYGRPGHPIGRWCNESIDGPLIQSMFASFDALRRNGWREIRYAPCDVEVEIIELGSTGIHRGVKDSETGMLFLAPDGESSRAAILFRQLTN